jgi:hypothetical protein
MKIVITTQHRENYGSTDQPYWKFKGGDTYVVPNLSVKQVMQVKERGIPTLTELVSSSNSMFEEYVIDWSILDDDAVVCDEWETPFNLYWEGSRWVARRTVVNGEHGYMRFEVASKTEEYVMLMGGDRADYKVSYTMKDGTVVTGDEVEAYFRKVA